MFSIGSKEQIFQSYNKLILTIFMSILLISFAVMFYLSNAQSEEQYQRTYQSLQEVSQHLDDKFLTIYDALISIQRVAENYLQHPEQIPTKAPLFAQDGDNYYLDKSIDKNIITNVDNAYSVISANITGHGDVDRLPQETKDELSMANAMSPMFVSMKVSLKEANWFYYISLNNFAAIYPWVSRNLWQYSNNGVINNTMLQVKKEAAKDAVFWSHPYLNASEKGLNTALGVAIYAEDRMRGAVLMNVNLQKVYDYLPSVPNDRHGYLIVDQHDHILIHKNYQKIEQEGVTFIETVPEDVKGLNYQLLALKDNIFQLNERVIFKTQLPNTKLFLIEYNDKANLSLSANHYIYLVFIFFVLCAILLITALYYVVKHKFVLPSEKFISHIEYCSVGDPGKVKPDNEWRQWFNIVEDLFGENRNLLQRLKEQNDELDQRVKYKTQELRHKSEQHQRDYALLNSVMNAIPDFILFNDHFGNLIGWNKAVESELAHKSNDIMGCHVNDVVQEALGSDMVNQISPSLGQYIETSHQQLVNTINKAYEVYNAPFYDDRSVVLGNIILIRDISQQYDINQALTKAKNQAEQANKIKSQFLANMSHEIRTPINALQGMIYLLENTQIDSVQRQYLQNAQSASSNLLFLVDELLDSAKVESNNMSIYKEVIQVERVLTQVINLNISQLNRKKLDFIVSVASDVPLQIFSDSMRLVQVLSNLLNNAIKFTEKGQVTLALSMTQRSEGNKIESQPILLMKVIDTGIGIEKSKQNILFEAFKQVDDSMTRSYGGTGLGLSICRHIVDLLDGEITVQSDIQQGSEFIVSIPIDVDEVAKLTEHKSSFYELKHKFASYTFINLSVAIPETLRQNFLDIDINIHDVNQTTTLAQFSKNDNVIVFVDSANYQQWQTNNVFDLPTRNLRLIVICQHSASEVPQQLLAQLESSEQEYLLIEFPLYRNVIQHIIAKLDEQQSLLTSDDELSSEENTELQRDLSGKVVLVAEDNGVNQLVITKLLEVLKADVIIAENGQEAIEKLEENKVDIVLMDIQMPVMDGLIATQHIRAIPQFKDLPIIAMTAHAREEDRQQCLSAGMNLHLTKPIIIDTLKETLFSVL